MKESAIREVQTGACGVIGREGEDLPINRDLRNLDCLLGIRKMEGG